MLKKHEDKTKHRGIDVDMLLQQLMHTEHMIRIREYDCKVRFAS